MQAPGKSLGEAVMDGPSRAAAHMCRWRFSAPGASGANARIPSSRARCQAPEPRIVHRQHVAAICGQLLPPPPPTTPPLFPSRGRCPCPSSPSRPLCHQRSPEAFPSGKRGDNRADQGSPHMKLLYHCRLPGRAN